MTLAELLAVLFPPGSQVTLTQDQGAILGHSAGPAWVLAGPGSGKTEVLTAMALRLLYVDNDPVQQERVPPESIVITTFTEKAARNLEDRIAQKRRAVVAARPELASIDVSKLRIGTLHGLCNDLMQEFRAPSYQNVRLMDEFEQALFLREHLSLVKQPDPATEIPFWAEFPWLFSRQQWQPGWTHPPSRWNATRAMVALLNRMTEDRVSVASLRATGGQLARLADLYDEYTGLLQMNFRCDFSQLQARFLDFLNDPIGRRFVEGDGTPANPGIRWVLVDEYQDTNPVQEAVYFRLAGSTPHNLVVVGDDDQAMYRFRGGSVECMVTFDDACDAFLGVPKASVSQYPLVDNFRSHGDIVAFFDEYIHAFPVMAQPGARAPKPRIRARRVITQTYPTVATIGGRTMADVAGRFADAVRGLVDNGVVNDPSECCLLLKSTKESPHNALPYVTALQARGLPAYNPRNKAFTEQEEVQGFLGALLAILDPHRRFATDPASARSVPADELLLRNRYTTISGRHPQLDAYVHRVTAAVAAKPGEPFDSSLQEIAYFLLSLEPFASWQADPVRRVRMARLTKLLESYSSMPVLDPATGRPRPGVTRGFLRASSDHPGEVIAPWLGAFYHLFVGYVLDAGFDDEEDDEVICPGGMVPVMTMHQSKGLEFPFVFVGHMGETPTVSASHHLETLFAAHPADPRRAFPRAAETVRAEMDLIRQYYVAYSRAKYALVLLGTNAQLGKAAVPSGPARNWARQRTRPL